MIPVRTGFLSAVCCSNCLLGRYKATLLRRTDENRLAKSRRQDNSIVVSFMISKAFHRHLYRGVACRNVNLEIPYPRGTKRVARFEPLPLFLLKLGC